MVETGTAVATLTTGKGLTATQAKNLEKIVKGDFADIAYEARRVIETRQREQIRAIEDRYSDESKLTEARDKVVAAVRAAQDKVQTILDSYEKKGIINDVHGRGNVNPLARIADTYNLSFNWKDKTREVSAVNNAARRLVEAVNEALAVKQRGIERSILIATISGNAVEQLIQTPDVAVFLAEVASQLETDYADEVNLLALGA